MQHNIYYYMIDDEVIISTNKLNFTTNAIYIYIYIDKSHLFNYIKKRPP